MAELTKPNSASTTLYDPNKPISIEEIELIPEAELIHLNTNPIDTNAFGTIVIEAHGTKRLFVYSIGSILVYLFVFGLSIYALFHDLKKLSENKGTAFMVCLMALIFGLMFTSNLIQGTKSAFYKTWIAVDEDQISFMRGLKHDPKKYKSMPRTAEKTTVKSESGIKVKTYTYNVILTSNDESIIIANGLSEDDANQYRDMVDRLIKAKLS